MRIITLTTDLGESAPQAGVLYGLIWATAPEARIVNLTHEIEPGDILAAQVVLENAMPFFPDGTIHLAVVMPASIGDGGMASTNQQATRVLIAQLGPVFFVGPDNGLITPLLEQVEADRQTVAIFEARLPELNSSASGNAGLHAGCASIAAKLANGARPEALGKRVNNALRVTTPEPQMLDDGWRGQVLQVDHFGNLATNIRPAHLEGMRKIEIVVANQEISGLSKTFGDGQPGDLIAVIDSSNRLSICVVNSNAAERLNVQPGDPVEVRQAGR